jgi:hypothetical protein
MCKSADELEHEVEASRNKLDQALDSLQFRLNVSEVTANLMNPGWRERSLNGTAARLTVAARANPLPAILICAGVGFLMFDAVRTAAERRRLVAKLREPAVRARNADLAENHPDRLHDRLDAALEESFAGSDPVSVKITK